jgi:hypothetical protein
MSCRWWPLAVLSTVLTQHGGQSGEHIFSGTDGKKRLSGWSKGHERMMRAVLEHWGDGSDGSGSERYEPARESARILTH